MAGAGEPRGKISTNRVREPGRTGLRTRCVEILPRFVFGVRRNPAPRFAGTCHTECSTGAHKVSPRLWDRIGHRASTLLGSQWPGREHASCCGGALLGPSFGSWIQLRPRTRGLCLLLGEQPVRRASSDRRNAVFHFEGGQEPCLRDVHGNRRAGLLGQRCRRPIEATHRDVHAPRARRRRC